MYTPKFIVDAKVIQKFFEDKTLMDDIFMDFCLNNNIPCVQAMIECLIPDKNLTVKEVHTQQKFQTLGRSIIIDVLAIDSEGRLYNIEIQRDKRGATMKRVRLHGAIIDVNSIEKGMKFDQLPECYIIFITEHDTFGFGDVLYSIHKTIDGKNIRVDDGQHILFLNCSAKDDGSKAWKLAHDMKCVDPEEIFIPEIAQTVKDNKDSEVIEEKKGEPAMDRFSQYLRERFKDDLDYAEERGEKRGEERGEKRGEERGIKIGEERGIKIGEEHGKEHGLKLGLARSIKNFRDKAKMTLEQIAAIMEIPLDEAKSLYESATK